MDPALISAVAASIGTLLAAFAGWSARKKMGAETESIQVKTAVDAVTLANIQMGNISNEINSLRVAVEEYKGKLEAALKAEMLLKQEIGRVKRRVSVLEDYIITHGLSLPPDSQEEPLLH